MNVQVHVPLMIFFLLTAILIAGVASDGTLTFNIDFPAYSTDLRSHRDIIRSLDSLSIEVYMERDRLYLYNYGRRDRVLEIAEEPIGAFTLRSGDVRSFRYRDFYTILYYSDIFDARRNDYQFRGRIHSRYL